MKLLRKRTIFDDYFNFLSTLINQYDVSGNFIKAFSTGKRIRPWTLFTNGRRHSFKATIAKRHATEVSSIKTFSMRLTNLSIDETSMHKELIHITQY